jgi:hypothetical protein
LVRKYPFLYLLLLQKKEAGTRELSTEQKDWRKSSTYLSLIQSGVPAINASFSLALQGILL